MVEVVWWIINLLRKGEVLLWLCELNILLPRGSVFLRAAKVNYTAHLYTYEARGGTEVAARELGIDEHATIKTLIMEDENEAS